MNQTSVMRTVYRDFCLFVKQQKPQLFMEQDSSTTSVSIHFTLLKNTKQVLKNALSMGFFGGNIDFYIINDIIHLRGRMLAHEKLIVARTKDA